MVSSIMGIWMVTYTPLVCNLVGEYLWPSLPTRIYPPLGVLRVHLRSTPKGVDDLPLLFQSSLCEALDDLTLKEEEIMQCVQYEWEKY